MPSVVSPYTQAFPANPLVMQPAKERTRQEIIRPVGNLYDFFQGGNMDAEKYLAVAFSSLITYEMIVSVGIPRA